MSSAHVWENRLALKSRSSGSSSFLNTMIDFDLKDGDWTQPFAGGLNKVTKEMLEGQGFSTNGRWSCMNGWNIVKNPHTL